MTSTIKLASAFFFIFTFASCGYDLYKDIDQAAEDQKVDEKEFKAIQKRVLEAKDIDLSKYHDDRELHNYIVSYLSESGAKVSVWNPTKPVSIEKYNFNVFLENSYSMDGYVEGVTNFENSIYDMLGNIKVNSLCDSLNLSYINNSVPFTKSDALAPDIEDFIKKLNPDTFKLRGGERINSDISDIIKRVLEKTNDKNLSILISDFVFSPGSGKDAVQYLNNQKVSIKVNITEKLKTHNLALAIYQMESQFKGVYYDRNNKAHYYVGNRPYYIWMIGNQEIIKRVLQEQLIRNSDPTILQKAVFTTTTTSEKVSVKIDRTGRIGDFKQKGLLEMIDADANNGNFRFSVAANFSESLRDKSYFSESKNYISSNSDYKIITRELTQQEMLSPAYKGYTHHLNLTTNKLVSEDLSIRIISKIPQWVEASSNTEDTNILSDKTQYTQTFGLKCLFEGISGAFNSKPDIEDNVIAEFIIKIKTK
jgi:hypothetical protein